MHIVKPTQIFLCLKILKQFPGIGIPELGEFLELNVEDFNMTKRQALNTLGKMKRKGLVDKNDEKFWMTESGKLRFEDDWYRMEPSMFDEPPKYENIRGIDKMPHLNEKISTEEREPEPKVPEKSKITINPKDEEKTINKILDSMEVKRKKEPEPVTEPVIKEVKMAQISIDNTPDMIEYRKEYRKLQVSVLDKLIKVYPSDIGDILGSIKTEIEKVTI